MAFIPSSQGDGISVATESRRGSHRDLPHRACVEGKRGESPKKVAINIYSSKEAQGGQPTEKSDGFSKLNPGLNLSCCA